MSERWRRSGLRARPPAAGDLPAYRALLGDPAVGRWLRSPSRPAFEEAEICEWHEDDLRHWTQFGFGPWLLSEDESGEVVGRGGLRWAEIDGRLRVEATWAIGSRHWGRGHASTLAAAAMDLAAELQLPEVIAVIEPGNAASRRVAEKAGMRRRGDIPYDGLPHDLYVFPPVS